MTEFTQTYNIQISRKNIRPDFVIKTNIQKIHDILLSMYFPYVNETQNNGAGHLISIMHRDNIIQYTDSETCHAVTEDEALQTLINTIYITSFAAPGYTLLHAAAIALDDDAYILLGQTTSGKSTLSAYLCNNGFEYLTDDICVINNSAGKVIPYRKNIMLRDGGRRVLENAGVELGPISPVEWNNTERFPYMPVPSPKQSEFNIKGLLFLKRNDTGVNSLKKMHSGDAFMSVLKSGLYYEKTSPVSLQMVKSIASAGCYHLDYCSMQYVCSLLKGGDFSE